MLTDCLIAAQAITRDAQLWTLDRDFERTARCSPLNLFTLEGGPVPTANAEIPPPRSAATPFVKGGVR